MGVPALFRWLSKKYPRIISAVEEEEPRRIPRQDGQDGEEELPIDTSGPNPNGEEFDCLYLDMNGIVHPCTHPEGKPAPETEEEMMLEIFAYTERVVGMIRPRRLLMMAIDGVAPRAKMNQQRSRRFRTAQEAKEKEEEKAKALEEWKAQGLPVTDEAMQEKKVWDSNAITPGTPFMDLLASSLRYWVARKLNTDPGWKNLQVIISDASVPGEGEHKIMDFIRRQRSHPEHDANTRHVIYGLDADLIMLSLATHEPYFKVLREDVFAQEQKIRKCHRCGREGHIAANCIGEAKPKQGQNDDVGVKPPEKKPFIFLDVVALREYLEVELNLPGLPFKFDLERAIDDWVFLIFFVGNDFLPHLPSLEIREGAIDSLLRIWKKELPRMGTWLTSHGKMEMKNVQMILEGIAQQEDDIFRKRKEQEERQEANTKRRKIEDEDRQRHEMAREQGFKFGEQDMTQVLQPNAESRQAAAYKAQAIAALESGKNEEIIANQRAIRMSNLSAAEQLKAELKGKAAREGRESDKVAKDEEAEPKAEGDLPKEETEQTSLEEKVKKEDEDGSTLAGTDAEKTDGLESGSNGKGDSTLPRGVKRSIDESETQETEAGDEAQETNDPVVSTDSEKKAGDDGKAEVEDTVKLWEPGYRERYYQQKFGVGLDDKEFRRGIVKSYMEGMSWVLAYYYQGCPSWTWYYPYHFAPFAVDFTDLDSLEIKFDLGKPFRPYDQLMGVLPATSRKSIPSTFHPLMTDEDSEIIDFYPETFSIDMNGKKMAWQGVALLPFIDETRLLKAINSRYDQLSDDEKRRNAFGSDALMISDEHTLNDELCALYGKQKPTTAEEKQLVPLNPANSGGINGHVYRDPDCVPGSTFNSPLTAVGLADLLSDRSISVSFEFPNQVTPHRSVLLKGVKPPKRVLTHEDREYVRRGPPQGGRGRGGRGGGRGGRFSSGGYGHHSMHMDEQNRQNGHRNGHAGGGGGPARYGNGSSNGGAPSGPNQSNYNPYQQGNGWNAPQGQAGGRGPYAYGGAGQQAPPASDYGQYGGYGQAQGQSGYGGPGANGGYGGYGGYGVGGAPSSAPNAPAAMAGGHQGGFSGGYGGYGNAPNAYNAYGGYGQYGGYGGHAAAPGGYPAPAGQGPPPQAYGGGQGYGGHYPQHGSAGFEAQGHPAPYGQNYEQQGRNGNAAGGSGPRPLGFRSDDGGRGNRGGYKGSGGRGGGGPRGGGPYGRY